PVRQEVPARLEHRSTARAVIEQNAARGQLRAALFEGVIRPGSRRQARRKTQLFASARQAMPGVIVVNPADDAPVIVGMKFLEMTTISAAPDNHRVLNQ